jgi:dipeptidyl aminopeptidase/acylaminoacyl peptidase
MFNALRFAGKDVTFLRYPGQGHVFEGDGLRDLWTREMAFFGKYLAPQTSAAAVHP